MQRKGLAFSQIYDVRAVRVLVPEMRDCYTALGIVHTLWRHIPKEFDDYIANPKENGYRSLHTAVIGPEGKVLEVQIRTHAMHEEAELGVCAHWRYKGTDVKAGSNQYEEKISWLRQVLEWHEELGDIGGLAEQLRVDIEPDRVNIFTPDGHAIDLPKGATPLDFASPYIESGQLYCMVQLFDISERQKKDALLHRAAHHDPVTGLLNRHDGLLW